MTIYCACCGKVVEYRAAWSDRITRTKICSKACMEKIQQAYREFIDGREK